MVMEKRLTRLRRVSEIETSLGKRGLHDVAFGLRRRCVRDQEVRSDLIALGIWELDVQYALTR